ncbi:hypothetical protein E2C01_048816 [Portunus trituberculatus]|uniref:Uncharacterized protein n=1 Tax=Portunus trituberculatus TaxID=210409 RepID=A0A5B7GBJ1_PORTR|nr:hypothetical protein [Portunus trituberculatus]
MVHTPHPHPHPHPQLQSVTAKASPYQVLSWHRTEAKRHKRESAAYGDSGAPGKVGRCTG